MYGGDSSSGRRSPDFELRKDALSGVLHMLLQQALP